jgi:hypothetical protein
VNIVLFVVTRTDREKRWLRRYGGEGCSGPYGYHDAQALLADDAPCDVAYAGSVDGRDKPPVDDPRWPTRCEHCDYAFRAEDARQVFTSTYYAAADGRRWPIRELPPGAMFDAEWWPERGPDGKWWEIVLPPGGVSDVWSVYGEAKGGGRWTVTGAAPKLTARPSILTPQYHGWLTDGVLVPC